MKLKNIDGLIKQEQEEKKAKKMIKEHKKKAGKLKLIEVKMYDSKNTVFYIRPGKDPEKVRARFYATKSYKSLPTDLLK